VLRKPGGRRRPPDRKEQIAVAAAQLFRESGFHRVGVDDVAAAVGIGGSAVYRHFASKQGLLAHVVFDGVAQIEQMLDAVGPGQPAGQLAEGVRGMARIAVTKREFAALWQLESRHLPQDARQEFRDRLRAVVRRQARFLQAVRPDLSTNDADLLSWAATDVYASPAHHSITLPGGQLQAMIEAMALRVLATQLPPSPYGSRVATATAALPPRTSRREVLLAAAARLFTVRGFQAVGIEEIGAAAGVSGPGVYRHFDSKQDLLAAVLNRAAEWLGVSMSRALASASDVRHALDLVLESYVDFGYHHPDLLRTLVGEVGNLPPEQAEQYRRAQTDYYAEWANLLNAVRPELSAAEARTLVWGAVSIVNDLPGIRRFRARPSLAGDLTTVASAVLLGASRVPAGRA